MSIRIAHITDTHLGYRALSKADPETGRNARTVDFERAFEWAVDDIIARKPDGIIHAVLAQDAGHEIRSAIRVLKASADRLAIVPGQEHIRIEIFLKDNLPHLD